MPLLEHLLRIRDEKGAGFLLLIDPDRVPRNRMTAIAEAAEGYGADAILVGGSFMACEDFDSRVADLKRATTLPVILFPGNAQQLSRHADGLLFLSLLSGRNPTYLIEEQVRGAPIIKAYGLEAIPTGYLLVESGTITTVQYVSGTVPIPRDKNDIAMAHALAARYMGMRMVYLEAGSGAVSPVPEDMISTVADYCELPVIVGGGIRRPEQAAARVQAGASFIVVGTRMEFEDDFSYMADMADAVHVSLRSMI